MITQKQVKTLTGYDLTSLDCDEFNDLLSVAILRLESMLCLDELPDPLPADLALLLARTFKLIDAENVRDRSINSKSVEDFSISYNNSKVTDSGTAMSLFMQDNYPIIAKYSQCDINGDGVIRSGKVGSWRTYQEWKDIYPYGQRI